MSKVVKTLKAATGKVVSRIGYVVKPFVGNQVKSGQCYSRLVGRQDQEVTAPSIGKIAAPFLVSLETHSVGNNKAFGKST